MIVGFIALAILAAMSADIGRHLVVVLDEVERHAQQRTAERILVGRIEVEELLRFE